ncbi:MAG: S8/S53 family peptidase [Cytophagales bacterium]|nr:S8/S53 family peptidase [Cytophagales bacterium]
MANFEELEAFMPQEANHKNWVLDYLKITEIKQQFGLFRKSSKIKVAVIDTGINKIDYFNDTQVSTYSVVTDYATEFWKKHRNKRRSEIINQLLKQLKQTDCPFTDDYDGYTFDELSHGTAISSYISGQKGISCNSELIMIKASNDANKPMNLPLAIYMAVALGAHVVNISLEDRCSAELHDAVLQAYFNEVMLVCSAGNSLEQDVGSIEYPAAFQRTLAIGGYDQDFKLQNDGARGRLLDFMCPSVSVPSLTEDDIIAEGTSIASGICSGIIALYMEAHLEIYGRLPTCKDLKKSLISRCVHPYDPGDYNEEWGYGIIHPWSLFGFLASESNIAI